MAASPSPVTEEQLSQYIDGIYHAQWGQAIKNLLLRAAMKLPSISAPVKTAYNEHQRNQDSINHTFDDKVEEVDEAINREFDYLDENSKAKIANRV
jgi:hypothetical protein